ncbi:MAG: hypothetical protein HN948_05715 [Clostridia bacterium]|jgi:hypothetical protein|nr:hypothetical protein [Clostridia bacterium]MBT7122492.1 hypothetical protein [Clostridia bacterium]
MKRILIMILVCFIAISLAACGGQPTVVQEDVQEQETPEPTEEPTPEPTPEPEAGPMDAVVDGGTYTNAYFGFTITVPVRQVWYTQEELAAMFGIDSSAVDVSDLSVIELLPLAMSYEASADPTQVANFGFNFSNTSAPRNDEEAMAVLEMTAEILDNALGTETIFADPTAAEFDGHHSYILDFASYFGDEIALSQAMILVDVEEGSLLFTYTYFTDEQLNDVIASASTLKFSK